MASAQELSESPPFEAPPLPPAEPSEPPPREKSVLKVETPTKAPLQSPAAENKLPMAAPESEGPSLNDERAVLLELVRQKHPWARFEPGAWRRVEVLSEVFDETGAFAGRTVSERTERLIAVGERSYTLSIEPVVQIAGRRTPGPVEARKLWLLNDRPSEQPIIAWTAGEPTSISLGETVVPCRTWTIDSGVFGAEEPQREEKLTLFVSQESQPAVLRRKRLSVLQGEAGPVFTESVTRFSMPAIYGDELTAAWHTESTTEHPSGERTEAFAIHGHDAPGGLFQRAVAEYDAAGVKTRWQVTRLVASGRTPTEDIGSPKPQAGSPSISVEVRPRRLLQLFRRDREAAEEEPEQGL